MLLAHAVECPPEAPPGSDVTRKLRPTVAGYYGNYGMSSAGGSPSWYSSSSSRAASTAQGAAWAGATWGNSGGEDNCYILYPSLQLAFTDCNNSNLSCSLR